MIILDDCAASKDVKKKTNELVNLAFSARHRGISVWVLTQQMTSIAKAFRENIACLVLFYSPSARDMKIIFENYAGDLTNEEKNIFLIFHSGILSELKCMIEFFFPFQIKWKRLKLKL